MTGIIVPGSASLSAGLINIADAKQRNGGRSEDLDASFQVVEFLLGKEHFAIDLFDIKEVVEYSRITRLPNSPVYIKGIIDLRGEITTIIDLKQRLAIDPDMSKGDETSRIIVLDTRLTRSKIGIMVDAVLAVSTYTADDVDNTATSGEAGTQVRGIIRKTIHEQERESTRLLIWLDIRRLIQEMESG